MDEKSLLGSYKLVLGLEVHLQPKTYKKMFCGCDASIWGAEPNTHTCPVCLGLPGALPVPNLEAVEKTQLLGLGLGCTLNKESNFDRKHYFYPDLPKGYQISQYKNPLCVGGSLPLDSGNVAILERIHLEEDVAKSHHEKGQTLIDFNKSSMPLIEIVTTPCFKTIGDAVDFCKQIQATVRYLGIGDVDMEKGQMRLEANISLRTYEMEVANVLPKYKVEIKNINSFRFMERAVLAEIGRQRELLEKGETPIQENRGYDEDHNVTVSQRSKEDAHDYRYFPEPDIPPMFFDTAYLENLQQRLKTPPLKIREELVTKHGISFSVAKTLIYILGEAYLNKFNSLVQEGFPAAKVANTLVNKKDALNMDLDEWKALFSVAGGVQISEESLREIVDRVITQNPAAVADYKKGKETSIQFLIGKVMQETKGKASPEAVKDTLIKILS